MRIEAFERFAAALLMMSLFMGCGGGTPAGPELGQVKGVITVDGTPIPGLRVSFSSQVGPSAFGETDANGAYELTLSGSQKGAVVGSSSVRIEGRDPSIGEESMKEVAAANGVTVESLKAKPVIPAKYNEKTELTADVKPGPNEFNFDLNVKKK